MRPVTALSLFLALSRSALGAPTPDDGLKIRDVDECKAVTVIISVLSQYQASATSFCSSFISIPEKTVTSATARHLLPTSNDDGKTSLTATDNHVHAEAFYPDIDGYSHAKDVGHAFLNPRIDKTYRHAAPLQPLPPQPL